MSESNTNMPGLWMRLTSEMSKDKKKTTILVVLLLVGGVFGGRLLVGKSVPSRAKASQGKHSAPIPQQRPAIHTAASLYSNTVTPRVRYIPKADPKITRDIFRLDPNIFPQVAKKNSTAKLVNDSKLDADVLEKARRLRVQMQAQVLSLQSTITGNSPTAIINGRVMGSGNTINGFQVVSVTARSCVVEKDGVKVTLQMKSWNSDEEEY